VTPLRVYGASISYYTGKLEGYLRYKEIPYERVTMGPRQVRLVRERTGASQMPAVELPDGRFMTDTTPMIAWLEAQHPEPPVLPRDPLLLRRGEEDGGAVLGAHVAALAVQRGRVVDREEDVEQGAVGDDVVLERHLHCLRVPGGTGAHLLVSRGDGVAARVPGFHVHHAGNPGEGGLEAPEAAAGQGGLVMDGVWVRH